VSDDSNQAVTNNGAANIDGGTLKSKFDFDYNKGLWWQIMNTEWTYEEYYDYINDPKVLVNPIRNVKLFENDFLELVTLTPWWLIPAIYVPTSIYYAMTSEASFNVNLMGFALGVAIWTFSEYCYHRFLFHCEDFIYFPRHSKFYGLHFLVHGIHHAFP
jgi:4-hydroxysphinganine ceramide fatty acyl 2-hydroxylase